MEGPFGGYLLDPPCPLHSANVDGDGDANLTQALPSLCDIADGAERWLRGYF